MSSCFNGDWHGRQLGIVAALLAVLACGSASAQSVADNLPFESSASGRVYNGTTPLRLWHQTRGYGMEASQTAFGGRLAVDLADAIGFIDGQFRVSNESQFGLDFGGGYRWMAPGLLTGDTRVYGVTGWYDGQETNLNNYFNQIGVSFESLGEQIDFRMNANIPLENEKSGDLVIETDTVTYFENFLTVGTLIPSDVALRIVDFEVAPRIFDLNAWIYAGGYQMDGNDVSDLGAKGGVRGYVTNDLAVDVGIQDDDTFGTNTVFQIIWTPGRTGAGPTSWVHTLADRMREQVYRNTYVATTQVERTGGENLTDVDGDDIRVVHVDFTSSAPGDGTFENPYTSLDSIDGGSQQGDIILVHAQEGANVYNGQSVRLIDEQRFLGEGDGIKHEVVTQQMGTIDLPESKLGAYDWTRPTIQNAPTVAITLDGETLESENFAGMEVSNFVITGGANAIISDTNGVAAVDINNLDISDTTGGAIELAAMTQTLENGTTRSRFAVTIDEIAFDDVGTVNADDDIQLDAGTNQTTISHSTAISNITSIDGQGVGINLIENQRAVTINNFNWNGNTSGLGALLITDAGTQGGVTLSNSDVGEDNLLQGGTANEAFAISIQNSAATHTVTGTKILNTGGDSIVVTDGAANLNFTGKITRDVANVNAILNVTGGHTGSLTFTELTANEGVIIANSGSGLQFNDADGVYTFNDLVDFTGTSAAVNVQGDSTAVLTFQDMEVTDTTGTAFTFNGGDASMTLTGRIVQGTAQTVLDVTNGHTGTLVFTEKTAGQGVILATNGDGLQFDNADGAYTFNDKVTLSGATAVINVEESADTATFNFTEVDIDYTGTGTAVTIANSDLQTFTISGDIDVAPGAGTARPVSISNNTGGSITFNTTIQSDQSGILVLDNTDTTVLFAGQVTLNTGLNTAVSLEDNANGGVRFNNIDITTSSGSGFVALNTDNLVVAGTNNTIEVTAGIGGTVGLSLTNVEVGTTGVAFESVDTTDGDNGIVLNNLTGGAVVIGDANNTAGLGGTIASASGNGVSITNAANVTLNGLIVEDAGANGIDMTQTTTTASSVTINDTNVTNAANVTGIGVDITNMSNVALNDMMISDTTGDGINIEHNNSVQSVVRVTTVDVNNADGIGIDYDRSATALSRLTLTDVDVDGAAAGGITMDVAGSNTVDITIRQGSSVTNNAGTSAVALNTTGGSKTVNVLIDSSTFDNNSTAATVAIVGNNLGSLNTTITSNEFDNANGASGRAYSHSVAAGTGRLSFNDNQATNVSATDEVLLTQTGGTFLVVDLPTIETRNNNAQVEQVGTITNDPGGTVPQPTP